MITGYQDGADLLLLNTQYVKPRPDEDGNWGNDYILITYRDNNTMEIKHEIIYDPPYTYYIDTKPYKYNALFKPKESFEPVTCKYRDIQKDIAERTNNLNFFYDNIKNGNRNANRELFLLPNIYGADIHIEDYYRYLFYLKYKPSNINITKSYFDIEVDIINIDSKKFVELGEAPISLMTLLDDKTNSVNIFIYNDSNNPLVDKFKNSYNKNPNKFFRRLLSSLVESLNYYDGNGIKRVSKYGLDNLQYKLFFYDEEIDMINSFFDLLDELKPTFLLAWNGSRFDFAYVYERIVNLGYDPNIIMSSRKIPEHIVYYYHDHNHDDDKANRNDYFFSTAYTTYIDQMITFMSRRKGQSELPKYNLDYVGEVVAKARKLSYKHITNSIKLFPYKDFELYVIYNIIDTIVQKCIEIMSMDIDYMFNKAMINNTRYHKIGNNTVYLKNRFIKKEYERGNIVNTNCNIFNSKDGYVGAYVANPVNFIRSGTEINGVKSDIYRNDVDYDYKALHPSLQLQHNISSIGLIGKAYIDAEIYKNPFDDTALDQAGMFFNDICSDDFELVGNRWFNLPSIGEIINKIIETNPLVYNMNDCMKIIDTTYIETPIYESTIVESPIYQFREETNICQVR